MDYYEKILIFIMDYYEKILIFIMDYYEKIFNMYNIYMFD